jgi:flagellar L-ring protein FlgH
VKYIFIILVLTQMGCQADLKEISKPPELSPIMTEQKYSENNNTQKIYDIFSDPRAREKGDIITVNIQINDKATIGNSTDRELNSKIANNFDWTFGLKNFSPKGNASLNVNSDSSTKGQGNIGRSEEIKLSIAAIVCDIMPNGNLIIKGSQEVRVNFELRELIIEGVVRPHDISRDNIISYDKIAEARISYGGRGRLMDVQQTATIHQIYDKSKPF